MVIIIIMNSYHFVEIRDALNEKFDPISYMNTAVCYGDDK